MINAQLQIIDHGAKGRLIGQIDDNLCSFISAWHLMTGDSSQIALVVLYSEVSQVLVGSRPAIFSLLSAHEWPLCVCVCVSV